MALRALSMTGRLRDDHTMSDLVVRPVDRADLPRLLDLYVHLNADDTRAAPEDAVAALDQLARYEGSVVLVGVLDDALVSTCTLIVIPNLTRGAKPYALIENVVTHADHRGEGFGRAVLDAALDRAWVAGCYKVMLMTGSKNPATLAFYAAVGFEQSKTGFQIRRASIRRE